MPLLRAFSVDTSGTCNVEYVDHGGPATDSFDARSITHRDAVQDAFGDSFQIRLELSADGRVRSAGHIHRTLPVVSPVYREWASAEHAAVFGAIDDESDAREKNDDVVAERAGFSCWRKSLDRTKLPGGIAGAIEIDDPE